MSQPAPELIEVLEPAYGPCPEFRGACSNVACWKPEAGHVPRGYLGATGTLDEVEIVLLINEPGNPIPGDTFQVGSDFIVRASANTLRNYQDKSKPLHTNMRYFLDLVFPKQSLVQQLRRTWVTETYLCSAPEAGANVRAQPEKACAEHYLARQLCLFPGRPVVAFGTKAQRRVNRVAKLVPRLQDRLIAAQAAAPRHYNSARQSWHEAAQRARDMIAVPDKGKPLQGDVRNTESQI